ncbi:GTPase IMAP family member 8-like [Chaetodon auriga]|uniref:GTPase IMAP family member 8-like n=1 Tax=Chaetodon auriga TaxID=39042 RepID=UPI004032A9A7
MRIVILGKTGVGKSYLANTIVGEQLFTVGNPFNSETSKCRAETRSVNGRSITLVDTPGLFDTDTPEEELRSEIVRCITECAPGPHAFLIVLKVETFTEQEQDVIARINRYFSEEVFRYATVVFTHGDQLPEGETIQAAIRHNNRMRDLVRRCGGRCHVIDNRYWNRNSEDEYRSNRFQVEALLNTLDEMVRENNGRYYTNEMLQAVQQMINQEEERIRQSSRNMSETEIRGQARRNVFRRLSVRLAGVGTGVLLGALFGVAVMVGLVFTFLKSIIDIQNFAKTATAEGLAGAATTGAVVTGAAVTAAGEAAAGVPAAGEVAAGVAAAGGAAAGAAGLSLGTAVGVSAAVGGVIGGVTGYHAAEGAETPLEAAQRTAEAVKNGALKIFSSGIRQNLFLQILQRYGFSPVCILMWTFKLLFSLKSLPHVLQEYGFSPVWIDMCLFKSGIRQNLFRQSERLKVWKKLREEEQQQESKQLLKTYRIVLLGKDRAGKSSLANTIFGEDAFKINHTSSRRTHECQTASKSVGGRRITLIDPPGFCDFSSTEEELLPEIERCTTECAPGPHAFFIVLKVEEVTKRETDVITKIFQYFSEEALKHAAVVFTHGDQLPQGMKIEEFVDQNKCLRDLLEKCGGRCHVVDNKHWKNNQCSDYRSNEFQVAELLNTTDKIVMENKGGCYTNKMPQAASRKVEEEDVRTTVGNMTPGDTGNEANSSVWKNVWVKFTGTAAESLKKKQKQKKKKKKKEKTKRKKKRKRKKKKKKKNQHQK